MYVSYIERANYDINIGNIKELLWIIMMDWMSFTAPVFALLFVASVASGLLQTRFMFSLKAVGFKFEKLNPVKGISNLLSKKSGIEVLKSVLKLLILVNLSYSIIMKEIPHLIRLTHTSVIDSIYYTGTVIFWLVIKVCIAFAVIAGLDMLFQKWQHKKDLMMTKQEVKEESKEREGNPLIKSRIRSLQRSMAQRRMMEDVKNSDIVVTNPTHYAVAIQYDITKMPAPKVVARGAGFIAQKIKETAREHNIFIVENKVLARSLFHSVKIGAFIPEHFYVIVAELLAEVYKKKKGFFNDR